jgi:AraC-like DNA-binding protein
MASFDIYSRFDAETGGGHRLHVVGARTRYTDVDCSRRILTIGARLRPGALPALFDVAANELTNRSVPAESLVRHAAELALSRLELDPAADTMSHVVSFIERLIARGRCVDGRASVLGAIATPDGRAVRDVAATLGIGERALRSWSAAHLGLGLRRFLRIRRLHTALEHRLSTPSATWSRIAAAAGFADQPHLVRDCHALLGESPGEFFARAG